MATTSHQIMPADYVPGPRQGQWTYSHYAALPANDQRYEIMDGVLYMTPPSPSEWHQKATVRFVYYLFNHVELAGRGRVYTAPFDVELAPDVVVQPDVIVLLSASMHKITSARIKGAPDLVIEVLSPGSIQYDRTLKYAAYARAGVKEYWIADPQSQTVEVLTLEEEIYHIQGVFKGAEILHSYIVPDLPVQVQQFFS
jgi:Uma2 family endonuclease